LLDGQSPGFSLRARPGETQLCAASLTTREPDFSMLEVAIRSFEKMQKAEGQ